MYAKRLQTLDFATPNSLTITEIYFARPSKKLLKIQVFAAV
jgi:hypothetical protein